MVKTRIILDHTVQAVNDIYGVIDRSLLLS